MLSICFWIFALSSSDAMATLLDSWPPAEGGSVEEAVEEAVRLSSGPTPCSRVELGLASLCRFSLETPFIDALEYSIVVSSRSDDCASDCVQGCV